MTETLLETSGTHAINRAASEPGFASALRAGQCAQRIAEGYLKFDSAFRAVTERAAGRFADRDWQGSQQDAVDRAELYERSVDATTADIRAGFSDLMYQPSQWLAVKRNLASLIADLHDDQFCKGFFNAITQRLFKVIGMGRQLEFADLEVRQQMNTNAILQRAQPTSLQATWTQIFKALPIEADWQDAEMSAIEVSAAIRDHLRPLAGQPARIDSIEWLDTVFYRFTRAYVIGHIHTDGGSMPFVLTLTNGELGVVIEALIMQRSELNTVLSGTRACFHVELEQIAATSAYLQTLVPDTACGELTALLGWPVR